MDEVPAYPPSGDGTHVFVHFEKRGLTTRQAVERLAKALGTNPRDAGFAGMKDRHAVTTQWASFCGPTPEAALGAEVEHVRVLAAARHPHKLRTGHLRGNRFSLRVRGEDLDAELAGQLLAELSRRGVPNYYGEQRFGRAAHNLERAQRWIAGSGPAPRDRFERKLLFSAWQSSLFNTWLAERIERDQYDAPRLGDVLRKESSGGLFVNADQDDALRRMQAWEVSPTGPMFGSKMRWPEGEPADHERDLLAQSGIDDATLARHAAHGEGTRRVARVRPEAIEVSAEPGALLVRFELPAGAYATVVMRELCKTDLDLDGAEA